MESGFSYTLLFLLCWVLPTSPSHCVLPLPTPLHPFPHHHRSPNTASFAPHSDTGRKWLHARRMNPQPSHNKPLHLSSKVSRVMGESVHGGDGQCMCLKCARGWTLNNCLRQRVWVWCLCERFCGISRHVWLFTCVSVIPLKDRVWACEKHCQ